MPITTVVFDIGGVLIDWDPAHLLNKLLSDQASIDAFRHEAITDERILKMDAGQSWAEQLAEIEEAAPHHLSTAKRYADRWVETIAGPIQGTVDLQRALMERGIPLYALSNYGSENFEKTVPVYPFLDQFEGRLVSGYEGVIKPDEAIYILLRDRFNLVPEETLFIDDKDYNTAAAQSLGFQTHTFQNPEMLESALTDLSLL